MRLIDADAVKEALRNRISENIDECINNVPTVDVLEQISDEIRQIVDEETEHDERWARGLHYSLCIIDKYK